MSPSPRESGQAGMVRPFLGPRNQPEPLMPREAVLRRAILAAALALTGCSSNRFRLANEPLPSLSDQQLALAEAGIPRGPQAGRPIHPQVPTRQPALVQIPADLTPPAGVPAGFAANVPATAPTATPSLAGRVVDDDGRGVPYATVQVSPAVGGAVLAEVASDADGYFGVRGLPAGGSYRLDGRQVALGSGVRLSGSTTTRAPDATLVLPLTSGSRIGVVRRPQPAGPDDLLPAGGRVSVSTPRLRSDVGGGIPVPPSLYVEPMADVAVAAAATMPADGTPTDHHSTPAAVEPSGLRSAALAPLTLRDTGGRVRTLGDFPGRLFLLHFTGSWCVTDGEIGRLKTVADAHAADGLATLVVACEHGSETEALLAAASLAASETLPVLVSPLDRPGPLRGLLGVRSLPATVLLDADGRMLFSAKGGDSFDKLERAVAAAP